jgi:hypothetical protein
VKLSEAADFKSRSIKPLCLPFNAASTGIPRNLIVIGWGRMAQDASPENGILQKAHLPFFDSENCTKKFVELLSKNNAKSDFVLSESQFCAGGEGEMKHIFHSIHCQPFFLAGKIDSCKGKKSQSIGKFFAITISFRRLRIARAIC